jgi:hypothetical protein
MHPGCCDFSIEAPWLMGWVMHVNEMVDRILSTCIPLDHLSAEVARLYLRNRGIDSTVLTEALLFHPSLAYYGEDNKKIGDYPALIAKITNSQGNVIGLQRIYLTSDGKKAEVDSPKKVLGSIKGSGIYFDPVGEIINVVEGPETALAVRQASGRPTVSTISAGGMSAIEIPELVKEVHLWADKDKNGVGEKAALFLADKLATRKISTHLHVPNLPFVDKKSVDWLDVLNMVGPDAIKNSLGRRVFGKNQIWDGCEYMKEDNFPTPIPIVHGLICEREFVILSATAKTGKSLLGLQLALSIARGQPFLDKFVTTKCRVLILQTEISDSRYSERLRQMTGEMNIDLQPDEICITSERLKIDDPISLAVLRSMIRENQFKLVVIDPFYTLHSKDEDKAKDIAPLLANLRQVVIEEGATCFLIHHQGKYGEKTDRRQTGHHHRGSSAFADVPDGSWSLTSANSDAGIQASLSFELRNFEPVDALRLGRKSKSILWSVVEAEKVVSAKEDAELIIEIVSENQGINKDKLKELLAKKRKRGFASRSADDKIQKAMMAGLIKALREGNEVHYYTPEHFPGVVVPIRDPVSQLPLAPLPQSNGEATPPHDGDVQ